MELVPLAIAALYLVNVVVSISLAQYKGRSSGAWALIALFFPLISLLLLALMPDLVAERKLREQAAEADHRRKLAEIRLEAEKIGDTKACPRCAETIKAAALVCRFCGHEMPGKG